MGASLNGTAWNARRTHVCASGSSESRPRSASMRTSPMTIGESQSSFCGSATAAATRSESRAGSNRLQRKMFVSRRSGGRNDVTGDPPHADALASTLVIGSQSYPLFAQPLEVVDAWADGFEKV